MEMSYRRVATPGVGGDMPQYRLYCLDGAGRIGLAELIKAADDEDAVRQAHEIKHHALKCEVWQRQRLVATLDAHALAD